MPSAEIDASIMRKNGPAEIAALFNLGPKSAGMLAAAGITTLVRLRAFGSVRAYLAVKKVDPRASLNLLWALEGALTGEPWQVIARDHRTSLLMALETARERGRH